MLLTGQGVVLPPNILTARCLQYVAARLQLYAALLVVCFLLSLGASPWLSFSLLVESVTSSLEASRAVRVHAWLARFRTPVLSSSPARKL